MAQRTEQSTGADDVGESDGGDGADVHGRISVGGKLGDLTAVMVEVPWIMTTGWGNDTRTRGHGDIDTGLLSGLPWADRRP
ncbi:hypothetical protein [Streptomyces sp. NPDC049744]|uniref:hypothetical protein n=1 Tax=Streptomyces sp. NPDC049744 TaxID=3154359 RepID=UPI0034290214